MARLEFDPIASDIGDKPVVSFLCYVSEPLSREDAYCLVVDSWFETRYYVKHGDVVAQIPGRERPDGKSVVWVKRTANIERPGDTAVAEQLAIQLGVEQAQAETGAPAPPPIRHPK